jgi:hypothetical protein
LITTLADCDEADFVAEVLRNQLGIDSHEKDDIPSAEG